MHRVIPSAPQAPAVPTPPAAPVVAQAAAPVAAGQNAAAIKAAITQLQANVAQLEARRSGVVKELTSAPAEAREGLQSSIENINEQIRSLDGQVSQLNHSLAAPFLTTSSTEQPPVIPVDPNRDIPEGVQLLAGLFIVFVLAPLSLTVSRWLWKRTTSRGGPVPAAGPSPEMLDRLSRMENTMDSVAVEVERISEGQRFVTKLMNETSQKALGVGQKPAEPIRVPNVDDAVRVPRERA
jgi:archaellum component FlaC